MDDRDTRCAAGGWLNDAIHCCMASAAYDRHGTVTGLKGITHEVAYVCHHNVNPAQVWEKGFASLNPNPRDPLRDVLFTRAPGVQLKDTISATGARETARRASQYGKVLGTTETVAAVNKYGGQIESSGFTSAHNEGVAARAGCVGSISRAALLHNAKSGALWGAICAAALAIYEGYKKWSAGEATLEEMSQKVLRETIIGTVSGCAGAIACTVAAAFASPGNPALWIGLIAALVVGSLVSKGLNALWDENANATSAPT